MGRQDDQVENISFLMPPDDNWFLPPAYDVTYSYTPTGIWTGQHQMSLNGKRDQPQLENFRDCANNVFMQKHRAEEILDAVVSADRNWPDFADKAGVDSANAANIQAIHRLNLLP